jgi:hypothetical protein
MNRRLAMLAALLVGGGARAQFALPADTNLFGDAIVRKISGEFSPAGDGEGGPEAGAHAKIAGYEHALVFQDGRQLRGEFVALTKTEIHWRRPDAPEPIRLPRELVRRIVLVPPPEGDPEAGVRAQMLDSLMVAGIANGIAGGFAEFFTHAVATVVAPDFLRACALPLIATAVPCRLTFAMSAMAGAPQQDKPARALATVKLPGSDWLFGDVTSARGAGFSVSVHDGAVLTIPRESVAWLHFGEHAAPAYGFFGSALDLEGWPYRAGSARMEVEKGTLLVRNTNYLGRAISAPSRFEIAFEIPEDGEEGLRLWLQPFGPQTNCYGTGTVELGFGRKQLSRCVMIRKFDRQTTPLPKDAAESHGPVSYRVLYDSIHHRFAVIRNGLQLGEWSLIAEKKEGEAKDAEADDEASRATISGICFERDGGAKSGGLKFNKLSVQQWDGVMLKNRDAASVRLIGAGDAILAGELESISEKSLVFSGAEKAITQGMFVDFHDGVGGPVDADARLVFGEHGELGVADLEFHDGRAHGRTSWGAALDLPAAALHTIAFSTRPPEAEPPADVLVFSNGDELHGSLVSAEAHSPLRWKMKGGQEIAFQTGHTAGVRLASGAARIAPASGASVELRNGDRLRGECVAFDETHLALRHAQLGVVTIAREQLRAFYPNARFASADGESAGAWFAKSAGNSAGVEWLAFDGSYILRGRPGNVNAEDGRQIVPPLSPLPERYELRGSVTFAGYGSPNCALQLAEKSNRASVHVTLNLFELQMMVNNPKAKQRPAWRNIPVREKIGDATSRMAVRAFVDSKQGTLDLFINGVLVVRYGRVANERIPGIGETLSLSVDQGQESPTVLSNLWIGPWSGDLPQPEIPAGATTVLTNGDTASTAPTKVADGKFTIESEAGPLELPVEKVEAIEFGGELAPAHAKGRIRLTDGCVLSVDSFRWENGELAAQSAIFGELRFPATAVGEIAIDPPPIQVPLISHPKKIAQKPREEAVPAR